MSVATVSTTLPADWLYCDFTNPAINGSSCLTLSNFASNTSLVANITPWWHTNLSTYANTSYPLIEACQNPISLYNWTSFSTFKDDDVQRQNVGKLYNTCLSLPRLYSYHNQSLLPAAVDSDLATYLPVALNDSTLKSVAEATTQCLIATCDLARNSTACRSVCSPYKLSMDQSSFALENIADCVSSLCHDVNSLPRLDSDIIGIGVWTSYLIQCIFALVAGSCVVASTLRKVCRRSEVLSNRNPKWKHDLWDATAEFHGAQCVLSIATSIAMLVNRSSPNMSEWVLASFGMNGTSSILVFTVALIKLGGWTKSLLLYTFVAAMMAWPNFFPSRGYPAAHDGLSLVARNQIPACGGATAFTICSTPSWYPDVAQQRDVAGFLTIVLALSAFYGSIFTLTACCCVRSKRQRAKTIVTGGEKYNNVQTSFRDIAKEFDCRWLFMFLAWSLFLLQMAMIIMQIYMMSQLLEFGMIDYSAEGWNFGQILALFAWVIPVLKYVYALFSYLKPVMFSILYHRIFVLPGSAVGLALGQTGLQSMLSGAGTATVIGLGAPIVRLDRPTVNDTELLTRIITRKLRFRDVIRRMRGEEKVEVADMDAEKAAEENS